MKYQHIYTAVSTAILASDVCTLPFNVEKMCYRLGIELVPLSLICKETGLDHQQVFDIWGNQDGVICNSADHVKISFNDYAAPGRIRFTICEEICHYILGHVNDPRFDMFNQQYDESTYMKYEEEARIGAGILLTQPQFFFQHEEFFNPTAMAYLCDISKQCAVARYEILTRFKSSISSNLLFLLLKQPKILKPLLIAS